MRNRQSRDHYRATPSIPLPSDQPRKAPPDMPRIQVGDEARIRNTDFEVVAVDRDRVCLMLVTGYPTMYLGLLVRWRNYTWRVIEYLADHSTVIEAWGRTALTSPRIKDY